jgi:cellulose synthase/poly-beta-1,6-N-acetylglucosamine synthase-like glycosyltransferase
MHPDCQVAVNIPAYHEERGIYHTLEEWANQEHSGAPIDKNKYEINVIVNREESGTDDKTFDEVNRFKREHPNVHVNLVKVVFPNGKGGVGPARKVITDLTLLRSVKRGANQKGSLYMESEDADLLEIDRRAVSNLITKFETNPEIDALRGKQDLAPEILKEHDYLFFERRVERLTEYLLRDERLRPEVNPSADSRWNAVVLGGWNSAYTAEAYALIGGSQNVRIGEDVDIGTRISR